MTSSVADSRCRYESRMSCCLASSRENTVTRAGRPASPDSRRPTTVFPSDPVPPVTSTRKPSNTCLSPLFVGTRIRCQCSNHRVPAGNLQARRLPEHCIVERSIDTHGVAWLDERVRAERLIQPAQQIVLGDWLRGHVIHAFERWVMLDHIRQYAGQRARCQP